MRILDLDGTKACYERIKLLALAEHFGEELKPETTAPFTVRWDPYHHGPGIFLDGTRVAHVKMSETPPVLHIRDACPERFDFAILRALRNATDFTDRIGKLQRAQTRGSDPNKDLFIRNPVNFKPQIQNAEDMQKALLGLEFLDKRITFTIYADRECYNDIFYIEGAWGRFQQGFDIQIFGGGLHSQHEGRTFGLRESALNLSLQEGLNAFNERMIPERLQDACTIFLNLHGSVDHESLQAEYDTTPEINRNTEVVTRFGPLSSVMKNEIIFHRFQGVRFGKRTHSGFQGLPNGFPVDPQLISDTLHTMELHWKAAAIGKRAADFPVLTADLLESRVMAVDFGYDG